MVMSETSLVTKHGSIITSQRVNGRVWNGNIHNCPARKSSKPNHPQENWCLQCFGTHKAQYWNIIRREAQQYTVCGTVRCLLKGWSLQFEANSENYCQRSVLLHDNAHPHTAAHTAEMLRKLKFEVMAHPPYGPDLAPSDYHLFGPLKEALRGAIDSPRTEKWRKQCMHGSLFSQKPPFWRVSGSLYNDGPSAMKSKGTMLKNDVNVSFLFVLQ